MCAQSCEGISNYTREPEDKFGAGWKRVRHNAQNPANERGNACKWVKNGG